MTDSRLSQQRIVIEHQMTVSIVPSSSTCSTRTLRGPMSSALQRDVVAHFEVARRIKCCHEGAEAGGEKNHTHDCHAQQHNQYCST